MAAIWSDPTLDAIDEQMEKSQDRRPRPYLGMSAIGGPCERQLWYDFRWCVAPSFDAATLKKFDCGHRGEDIQAARLRTVPGLKLHTHDENGRQFGFADIGGHMKGHMDGAITGLVQDPETWHVWEHKQSSEKVQGTLAKFISTEGEHAALIKWNETYYGQAQLYMHYSGMHSHYLTCSTPGGRSTISVMTPYDVAYAERLIERARRVVYSPSPEGLERVSDRPDWFQCKWCRNHAICHKTEPLTAPVVSCRSCVFSTPNASGSWDCVRRGTDLSQAAQHLACDLHLYHPELLPWGADDTDEAEWIRYANGIVNHSQGSKAGERCYTSREIFAACSQLPLDDRMEAVRVRFRGEISEGSA